MTAYIGYTFALAVAAALLALAMSAYLDGVGYTVLHLVALAGVGAYVFAILTRTSVPPPLAAAVSIMASTAGGYAIAQLVRWLRGDGLTLATFGIGVAAFEVFRYLRITDGVFGIGRIPGVFPGAYQVGQLGTALAALAASIVVVSTWRRSTAGVVAIAIRLDEAAAVSIGARLRSHQQLTGSVAGALAGLAGVVLAASTHFIEPRDFQPSVSLLPIVAVMVARGRTPSGVVVAALAIALLSQLGRLIDGSATLAGPLTEITTAVALIGVLVLTRTWRGGDGRART